ncbi:hypothetical protein [Flectobacillus longus]|uniref:hypothetical protein n=1 Tax=Flectobacillus longus TaxID=2984207 RepID=UPI0024B675E1|nr:hypothetical protein [Flectobacillus longus]MDI9877802.1 hypothetical protein [Flectobacillus longus]
MFIWNKAYSLPKKLSYLQPMDKMEALELSPIQHTTLDIYRFCVETSLGYTDYISLSDEDIEIDKEKTIFGLN